MRRTNYFAPTLKETPAEATAISHRMALRAGLIRMVSAGIYAHLPLGWRSAKRVMEIIREEIDGIGGQEFLLPALTPIELWDETGRSKDFGEEMFRLKDRKKHDYCLAPTHEEVICFIARNQIRSWRDLPQIWYQIQTKFRDEPRPRGGVLRTRQFIMKDSYSLDRDEKGLDLSYELHRQAYEAIFRRCGLNYFIVGASSGVMGGSQSQEFMVESESGEDEVVRCYSCGYAANIEVATTEVEPVESADSAVLTEVETPEMRTVDEVSKFLNLTPGKMVKTLIYVSPSGPVVALVAGDDELSEAKLASIAGGQVRHAEPDEVKELMGAEIGFLGPHGDHQLPIFADHRLEDACNMATGANRNGYHVTGLEFGRDVNPDEYVDLRTARDGEPCPVCCKDIRVLKAIELGHIFKLGTKYSAAMRATFLDESGKERPIVMGSYGIGVERIVAAAIEEGVDENGIRWNSAISPVDVTVVPLNMNDENVVKMAEHVYDDLQKAGFSTLLDDREASPGVKLKDADLMGFPVQVVVSPRNIARGVVEVKDRRNGKKEFVDPKKIAGVTERILKRAKPGEQAND